MNILQNTKVIVNPLYHSILNKYEITNPTIKDEKICAAPGFNCLVIYPNIP